MSEFLTHMKDNIMMFFFIVYYPIYCLLTYYL